MSGIAKGRAWGHEGGLPTDLAVAAGDVEAAAWFADGVTTLALAGGDLARTLGTGPGSRAGWHLPVDVLRIAPDDGEVVHAVAHVVVRRWAWRGAATAVMNAQWLAGWNVAPRGHPGDGKVEVVRLDVAATWRDRLQIRRRLPTGTHLPHPLLSVTTATEVRIEPDAGQRVWIDGHPHEAVPMTVTVLPGALTIVV